MKLTTFLNKTMEKKEILRYAVVGVGTLNLVALMGCMESYYVSGIVWCLAVLAGLVWAWKQIDKL